MKNKIVIGYATQQSKEFRARYNQELTESAGLNEHELTIIPYENDGSMSLTATYNDLWECAESFKDAVFVFIHDDIHFKTKDWGKKLLALFNDNAIDIIGVAGTDTLHLHGNWIRNKTYDFNYPNVWGKVWHIKNGEEELSDYTSTIKHCATLQPVVALDGIVLAFNPDTCEKFNEYFDGFHFYDIAFCVENALQGKRIAVTESIQILHESEGTTSDAWEQSRLKFTEKYRSHLPISVQSLTKKI